MQLESWFVEMCVATAVVVVFTLTLLGREARQKKIALERQLQEMTLRVQQAEETILQHSVTPEETSLLSFMKELNVSAASIERVLQARAGAGAPKVDGNDLGVAVIDHGADQHRPGNKHRHIIGDRSQCGPTITQPERQR